MANQPSTLKPAAAPMYGPPDGLADVAAGDEVITGAGVVGAAVEVTQLEVGSTTDVIV